MKTYNSLTAEAMTVSEEMEVDFLLDEMSRGTALHDAQEIFRAFVDEQAREAAATGIF